MFPFLLCHKYIAFSFNGKRKRDIFIQLSEKRSRRGVGRILSEVSDRAQENASEVHKQDEGVEEPPGGEPGDVETLLRLLPAPSEAIKECQDERCQGDIGDVGEKAVNAKKAGESFTWVDICAQSCGRGHDDLESGEHAKNNDALMVVFCWYGLSCQKKPCQGEQWQPQEVRNKNESVHGMSFHNTNRLFVKRFKRDRTQCFVCYNKKVTTPMIPTTRESASEAPETAWRMVSLEANKCETAQTTIPKKRKRVRRAAARTGRNKNIDV